MLAKLILISVIAFYQMPTLLSGHYSAAPLSVAAAVKVAFFADEGSAQSHCPSDEVVWLNTKTGVYHEKGMRWYGRTKSGAYVCRKEADAAGYRDTRNGQ